MYTLRSMFRSLTCAIVSLGLSLTLGACGGSSTSTTSNPDGSTQSALDHLYAKSTSELKLEIDYQTGADPYTGTLINMDTWNLFTTNADALFNNEKMVSVPNMLAQMEMLTDITGTSFTVQQILDIATKHRSTEDTSNASSFYVLFLNGYFNDGTMVRNDVLGVSIGTTSVIAMFKPVIASTSNQSNVRKFVEQSTLIHEFGHGVGLVNNGVSMVTPHQDTANGNHDTNQHCVMYYANEGGAAAAQYVQQYISTGNEVLFDSNCLADIAARLSAAK